MLLSIGTLNYFLIGIEQSKKDIENCLGICHIENGRKLYIHRIQKLKFFVPSVSFKNCLLICQPILRVKKALYGSYL